MLSFSYSSEIVFSVSRTYFVSSKVKMKRKKRTVMIPACVVAAARHPDCSAWVPAAIGMTENAVEMVK